MRRALIAALAAAIALGGLDSAFAQAPPQTKSYTVDLDAETDYFSVSAVQIVAVSRRQGRVPAGTLTVRHRQRITVDVPPDATELVFTAENGVTARVRLTVNAGTILIRPLGNSSSFAGIRWALGSRRGVEVKSFYTEFTRK